MLNIPFLKNFTSGNRATNKFLTIDIGSDSIKVLAFYQDEHKSKIIGFGKRHLEPGYVRNGTIVEVEAVQETLQEAILEASQNTEEQITDVIFGVSGNYSINQLTTARLTRPDKSPIQESEIEKLNEKISSSALEQALTEINQTTGSSDIEIELITSATSYIKADEHFVKDAVGLTATRLEMGVFTAFTPTYHLKNINKISKKLGLNIIAIAPEMYSVVKALSHTKSPHLDCVIINVGSDKTDIGVVFGGNIVSTKCLPIGGAQFTYQISQHMGLAIKEAENLKKTYSVGKLTHNESIIVQECLSDVLKTWISGVEIVFSEFTGVKTFASKVYLTGGGINLPDAFEYLSKEMESWTRSIPFKATPEFLKVALTDVNNVSDATQKVSGPEWIMPAALSYIYMESKGLIHD